MVSIYYLDLKSQSYIINLQLHIPVNVQELAYKFGITIVNHDYDDNINYGYIEYIKSEDKFYIHINPKHSDEHQRFTIAHEIAHYLLHRNYIKETGSMDRGAFSNFYDDKETEANKLAADILMPYAAIEEKIESGISTIQNLAKEFVVSEDDMRRRLGFM